QGIFLRAIGGSGREALRSHGAEINGPRNEIVRGTGALSLNAPVLLSAPNPIPRCAPLAHGAAGMTRAGTTLVRRSTTIGRTLVKQYLFACQATFDWLGSTRHATAEYCPH